MPIVYRQRLNDACTRGFGFVHDDEDDDPRNGEHSDGANGDDPADHARRPFRGGRERRLVLGTCARFGFCSRLLLADVPLGLARLSELVGQRSHGAAIRAARGFDVEIVGDRDGRAAARAVHGAIIYGFGADRRVKR